MSSPVGLAILKEGTYNKEFLVMKAWTNKDIVNTLKLQDLTSTSSMNINVTSFKSYLQHVLPNTVTASFKEEKFMAFLTHGFPPVFLPDKTLNLQVKVDKNGLKYIFKCVLKNHLKQVYQHGISRSHI